MDTNLIQRIGRILMGTGFMWGAFLTVKYVDKVEWSPYGVAFMMTAVGAALLRFAAAKAGGDKSKVSADMATIEESLRALVETVRKLDADKENVSPFVYSKRIDDECMETINDFVEAREAMSQAHGLDKYALMMDSFALGERALNRTWCASADGYIDEVHACLARSLHHFEEALGVVLETTTKRTLDDGLQTIEDVDA